MATLHKDPLELFWDRMRHLPRLRINALIITACLLLAGILYYSVELIATEELYALFFAGKLTGMILVIVAVIWSPVNALLLIKDTEHSIAQNVIWIFISLIPLVYYVVTSIIDYY